MKPENESGQNRPVKSQDVLTQKEQSWYDRPHDELVRDIKSAVSRTRADYEAQGRTFDPVRWVGDRLTASALRASGDAHRNLLDTSLAWDAISRPFIQDPDYQKAVGAVLMNGTAQRGNSLVRLNSKAVTLLDAMADAVGVPYSPEQTTIDLFNDEQKRLFRTIHKHTQR